MRLLRPSLNRFVARLMCWVLLLGWMAGAANACVLQAPAAAAAAQAAAHGHAAGQIGPHHHHGALSGAHDHDEQGDEVPPGQQACKNLCDSEQSAVAKTSAGDQVGVPALAAAATGSYLVMPAAGAVRVPRPNTGNLPTPPPIPIAFLRLTI